MQLLQWFEGNSATLQGIAAATVIIAALVTVPAYLLRATGADVTISVRKQESTLPSGLADWSSSAASALRNLRPGPDMESFQADRIEQLTRDNIAERLRSYRLPHIDKLTVTITNQTDRTLAGARLRVEGITYFWGTRVSGNFLTYQEAMDFQQKLDSPGTARASVDAFAREWILPELPPLPPRSALSIEVYGSVSKYTTASLSVASATVASQEVVEISKSWLVDLQLNPWKLGFLLPLLFLGLTACAGLFAQFVWPILNRRIVARATPGILYNAACQEAKRNRLDSAIQLLQAAFVAGFRDRAHARQDPDLELLRDQEEFRRLVN